jgi:hypothetical protein
MQHQIGYRQSRLRCEQKRDKRHTQYVRVMQLPKDVDGGVHAGCQIKLTTSCARIGRYRQYRTNHNGFKPSASNQICEPLVLVAGRAAYVRYGSLQYNKWGSIILYLFACSSHPTIHSASSLLISIFTGDCRNIQHIYNIYVA